MHSMLLIVEAKTCILNKFLRKKSLLIILRFHKSINDRNLLSRFGLVWMHRFHIFIATMIHHACIRSNGGCWYVIWLSISRFGWMGRSFSKSGKWLQWFIQRQKGKTKFQLEINVHCFVCIMSFILHASASTIYVTAAVLGFSFWLLRST